MTPTPHAALGVAPPTALRGPVFVTTACALAVVAHLAGGGELPGPGRLLLAVLVAALGWAPGSDRPQGLVPVLLRVGAVQAALHVVLGQTLQPDLADAAHPGHVTAVTGPAMSGGASGLMWGAHAAAAVLLALWLLRGERAAWAAVVRALLRLAGPGWSCPLPVGERLLPEAPAPRPHRRPWLPAAGLRAPPLSA